MNKLVRSKNRVIAGVCGGFGEYLNIDITLVRLLYILFTCASGLWFGILFYLIASLVIPEE